MAPSQLPSQAQGSSPAIYIRFFFVRCRYAFKDDCPSLMSSTQCCVPMLPAVAVLCLFFPALQSAQRVLATFTSWDLDGSGTLSRQEFSAISQVRGLSSWPSTAYWSSCIAPCLGASAEWCLVQSPSQQPSAPGMRSNKRRYGHTCASTDQTSICTDLHMQAPATTSLALLTAGDLTCIADCW
jgi:hypothetical protein